MAEMIKFLRGRKVEDFLKLATKDPNTLYFCEDGALYLGEKLIADKTGDYDAAISNVIAALDATVTSDESGLIQVTIVETDGKLTSVAVEEKALLGKFAEYYTSEQIDEKIGELKIGDVTYDSVVDYIIATTTSLATGKADKKVPVTAGNIATLDAEGNLADGGETIAQIKEYARTEANTAAGSQAGTALAEAKGYAMGLVNGLEFVLSEDGKELALKDKEGETITTLDTTEFVVDGFLSRVVPDQDANTLTFYWNTDSGEASTVVNLSDIADIYTGSTNNNEVNVAVSNTNVITATIGDNVKADIAKGVSAYNALDGKADKVSGATAGHFAGLDAEGNLTDSGKTVNDFVPSEGYVAYSEAEKAKLEGIEAGAQVNKIEVVKLTEKTEDGVETNALDITEKAVTIDLSNYAKIEDLSGLGYGDMLKSEYDTDGDGKVDKANHADTADDAGKLEGNTLEQVLASALSQAKGAIQGSTTVTVEALVNALNKLYNGQENNSASIETIEHNLFGDDGILVWGTFGEDAE